MASSTLNTTKAGKPVSRTKRWAPKTTTGCITCKKRHVKCDEARPTCHRCFKAKIACAGYALPARDSRGPLPIAPRVGAAYSDDYGLPLWDTPTVVPSSTRMDIRDLLYLAPTLIEARSLFGPAQTYHSEYSRMHTRELATYAQYLPARIDYDETLDCAIQCASASLREFSAHIVTHDTPFVLTNPAVLAAYSRALNSLQRALRHPERSKTAEILCATKLLMIFECTKGTTTDAALFQHTRGAALLIEHRGPEQFNSDFDRSLLTSHLPLLYLSMIRTGEHSFLNESRWLNIIQRAASTGPSSLDRCEFWLTYFGKAVPFAHHWIKTNRLITYPPFTLATKTGLHNAALDRANEICGILIPWHESIVTARPAQEQFRERWTDMVTISLATVIFQLKLAIAIGIENAKKANEDAIELCYKLERLHTARKNVARATALVVVGMYSAVMATHDEWTDYVEQNPQLGPGGQEIPRLMPPEIFWRLFQRAGFMPPPEPS
ncbi:hypothetical protein VHEMI09333 [[Torrubiella] hemipterigena]|uniref:Zn(2)-C6 fungal-type domain-containing protein n=1 Tax=[Torrubiella] hemipterigena TaxID=1531966 RepID=A0A0A1TG48_9HYPO|nr:hypothetical protein VHEMI09333 [[Torrubiella] hemipterigena]